MTSEDKDSNLDEAKENLDKAWTELQAAFKAIKTEFVASMQKLAKDVEEWSANQKADKDTPAKSSDSDE